MFIVPNPKSVQWNYDRIFQPNSLQSYQADWRAFLQTIVIDPIFANVTPNKPITLDDGTPVTASMVSQALITDLFATDIEPKRHNALSNLFQQVAHYQDLSSQYDYTKQLMCDRLLDNQAPLPSDDIRYDFTADLLPATTLLNQNFENIDARKALTIGLTGYMYRRTSAQQTTFVIMKNQNIWRLLLSKIKDLSTAKASNNPNVNQLINTIMSKQIDPKDMAANTWLLGDGGYANDHELSFNKYIMCALSKLLTDFSDQIFLAPLSFRQQLLPTAITFIDMSSFVDMTATEFAKSMHELDSGLNYQHQYHITSLHDLNTAATCLPNAIKPLKIPQAPSKSLSHNQRSRRDFTKVVIRPRNQYKIIKQLISKFVTQQTTSNAYKTKQNTFQRANRRHPDDINLPGTISRTRYRPDVAIYLDTSGSISESQYRTAILAITSIAKKLNVNLLFTSFSDHIAQPAYLKTKNKTVGQIYTQIHDLPKVAGGTEYENVWDTINFLHDHTTLDVINFIITDFQYTTSSSYIANPKQPSATRTYYLPIDGDAEDMRQLRECANSFAQSKTLSGDPSIYQHIIL